MKRRGRAPNSPSSFGGQFGLTDATSDAALKVFIGYEFF